MKTFIAVLLTLIVAGSVVKINDKAEASKPEPVELVVVAPTYAVESVEPVEEIEEEPVNEVDPHDLEILAHLLNGEAGADYCSDGLIYYVGSVVLNRVASEYFPDTIEGVVFQDGQYACTWDGNYDREPSERCYRIAEDLLLNGSLLPEDVVFQAEFEQGSGVYAKVENMYFCYRYIF